MTRKKKPLPILENITIEDVAAEGKSIARVNDMVVFVPFAVPGDVVDLQIRKKKHTIAKPKSYGSLRKAKCAKSPCASISEYAAVANGRICPTKNS